jgi:hypothetical protein
LYVFFFVSSAILHSCFYSIEVSQINVLIDFYVYLSAKKETR